MGGTTSGMCDGETRCLTRGLSTGPWQFFCHSISFILQLIHHLLQMLNSRDHVWLLLWRGLNWCPLVPERLLVIATTDFRSLCQLLHKFLTRRIVCLKTLPCPLDERFCLAQKDCSWAARLAFWRKSFKNWTSGPIDCTNGCESGQSRFETAHSLLCSFDRDVGEARFHWASWVDANGLELPFHDEPVKDSAKRQKFHAPLANFLWRGPRIICTHPSGAGNHPRRGMTRRLTRVQKEENTY